MFCKQHMVAALGIAAVSVGIYIQAIGFLFVDYDDNDYVFYNPHVLNGLTLETVKWAWTTVGYSANWHPLTWMSLQSDATLAGAPLQPMALSVDADKAPQYRTLSAIMHGHNVLLHGLNAALLFIVICAVLPVVVGRPTEPDEHYAIMVGAAITTLLWAVHPLRAEVVCWVSERKELLSVFWALASVCCYHFAKEKRSPTVWYNAAVLMYALSLSAKPVAVGLPAILLAYDLIRLPRLRLLPLTPFVALAASSCALTLVAQQEAMSPLNSVTLSVRLLNALATIAVYLQQSILPVDLVALYPMSPTVNPIYMASGLVVCLAALTMGAWLIRLRIQRKDTPPHAQVCLLLSAWCLVGLLPMLGIVHVGSQAYADRYTYWVGCGFAVGVAFLLQPVIRFATARFSRKAVYAAGLALVAPYAVLGFHQAKTWSDSLSLFQHAYDKGGQNAWAAFCLAEQAVFQDPARAAELYRESIAKSPQADSLAALAILLAVQSDGRDFREPLALATRAVQLSEKAVKGHEALGLIALRTGALADAEEHFLAAVAHGSKNPVVRQWLETARRNRQQPPLGPRILSP